MLVRGIREVGREEVKFNFYKFYFLELAYFFLVGYLVIFIF